MKWYSIQHLFFVYVSVVIFVRIFICSDFKNIPENVPRVLCIYIFTNQTEAVVYRFCTLKVQGRNELDNIWLC